MNTEVATWEKQEMFRLLKSSPGTAYQEADETNKTIMRDWVRSLLQKQPITVTFVKADGTDREMLCTLDHTLIPETPAKPVSVDGIVRESKKPRKEPDPHSIRVFE